MNSEKRVEEILQNSDFYPVPTPGDLPSVGQCLAVRQDIGQGLFWFYSEEDLFNIKIQSFFFHKDQLFDPKALDWPDSLSIVYCESVSGEEFTPYRRLTAGCVKTFFGNRHPCKTLYHKNVPIKSISIEIFPAYYQQYLKEAFPDEYQDPYETFHEIDQTNDFPEMVALLRQVESYRGEGMAAKLFYRSKVSEAVALMIQHGREHPSRELSPVSQADREALGNIAAYMNDHYNRTILLEQLARIACMGTTKLKKTFREVYGCTITEYIRQRRLSQGENLLASTDFSIEQIAMTVGYSNAGRFSKDFRNSTGLNPSEYRKHAQRIE